MTKITRVKDSQVLDEAVKFFGCWTELAQQHVWRYVFVSQYVKNRVVLDVACGVGYGSDYLSRCGAKQVIGVDFDQRSLQFARGAYVRPNLNFVNGNALTLPISDHSLDVVISFETIEHIREQEVFLAEIWRVLKMDGIFICSTPNTKFSMGHIDHVKELTPAQFYRMLKTYFGKVEKYGQYITFTDRKFELSEFRAMKFQLRRKKGIFLKRLNHWMKKSPFGIYLRPLLRWIFHKITSEKRRDRLDIADALVSRLDSKYAVRRFDKNYQGVFLMMVAVCERGA